MSSLADRSPDDAGIAVLTRPAYEERIFFVGANGSGKTMLASGFASTYERITILDVKGDFPVPWPKGEYQVRTKPPGVGLINTWRWRRGNQRIIYRPAIGYDSGEAIAAFFDEAYRQAQREKAKKPRILYVDEGAWVSYAGAWRSLARLLISTRSLKLGIWLASQRPKGLPVEARSEAWRWYVFYLRSKQDRQEVVSYLDRQISEYDLESTTKDFEFWEIRRGVGGKMTYRLLPPIRPPQVAAKEK